MNLGIGADRVKNVLQSAINLLLTLSVRNIVVQCETNNISTDSRQHIADGIIDVGTLFSKKSVSGLILHYKWWLVNALLINKVYKILIKKCHKYGFTFIVQDHGWILMNC